MSEPIYVHGMPIYVLNPEGRDDCVVPIAREGVDDCVVPIAMTSEAERPLLSCECVPAVVCPSHRADPTPADVAQADTLVQGWWTGQDSSLKDLRALIAQAIAAARAEGERRHVEHHRCERCYAAGVTAGALSAETSAISLTWNARKECTGGADHSALLSTGQLDKRD
ncbi:MAG TPA: hypothetical protein VJ301_11695 [Propionibacteriaceae bacterium]|nr:hypothetical protein [Propionibacteriaceae bacterium]